MKKLIFIFPLITLFLVNTSLFAAGKLNVAVIGNEPDLRAKIESLLANTDFLQPVERTRIDSLLKEMKLGQQVILKEGTFARAG